MKISVRVFWFSTLILMAMRMLAGTAAAMLFGLPVGVALASPGEQPDNSMAKRVISKTIPRPLPDASCLRQESLDMVLDEVVSIGLKQHPQCQDYRVDSRKFVNPENVAGEFEELWVVAICGKKVNFEITRKHIGYRKSVILIHALP
jgi:hypothetical protein